MHFRWRDTIKGWHVFDKETHKHNKCWYIFDMETHRHRKCWHKETHRHKITKAGDRSESNKCVSIRLDALKKTYEN